MENAKSTKTPSKVLQPKSSQETTPFGVFQFQDKRPEGVVQQTVQQLANKQNRTDVVQPKANNTGLPNQLKSGIENLSGYSMDDVKVHYNSPKPAQLQAHAYAQGTDIHIASGQEKHLPHEAWHVVQQKQGRVKPTTQLKGTVNINDDAGLEKEADVMGAKAMQMRMINFSNFYHSTYNSSNQLSRNENGKIAQLEGYSLIGHYLHKAPQIFDLLTSFRRQRMLVTSTLTRFVLNNMSSGKLTNVKVNNIMLLHPNSLEDSKTKKRYDIICSHLKTNKSTSLSKSDISRLIPSDEEIQVAKLSSNNYISLQGVGRIVALKEAALKEKIDLTIEVLNFDLTKSPLLSNQLESISKSYGMDEGIVSKLIGTGISIGAAGLTYLAGGKVLSYSSWIASKVYSIMENTMVNQQTDNPFENQLPRGGTRTDI